MAGNFSSGSGYSDDGSPLSAINVTPLVDVTLVLLIVFMITVPAIIGSAPVKVDLPESRAIAAASEQMPMMFSLKRGTSGKLELYLNERLVDEAEIRHMFIVSSPPSDEQRVSLAADKGIPYGEVVKVVDLLQSLGLKKLSLETRHVEPQ
jgi:biopolymer transport protein ExbD